ncbi:hypothetical protein NUW58_g10175 [Xylaria curta]|uniref:Uncharacterized protein n=1 Tax=Xylaria curta TaxID=42375 RepID=A0ACC1MQ52_9PEZI|nr:hypothetical protein NUW58_g10175 [Xylaria curta]
MLQFHAPGEALTDPPPARPRLRAFPGAPGYGSLRARRNPHTTTFTSLGCPVFSAGEAHHVETLFIASHLMVLHWLQEVADTPGAYKNPGFTIVFSDGPDQNNLWSDWNGEDNRATEDVKSNKDDTTGAPSLCIVPGDGVEKDGSGRGEEKNEQTQYVVRTKPDNGDGNGPEQSEA